MVDLTDQSLAAGTPSPTANRERYHAHEARLERRASERATLLAARKKLAHSANLDPE